MSQREGLVQADDPAFYPWRENFKTVSGHRRCQNILKAFNDENQLRDEYEGRELLEMIQNADDQCSDMLDVYLDTGENFVELTNCGAKTEPFSKRGFECLITGSTSEKKTKRNKVIGSKGRGFRSLLNWAWKIEVWSNGIYCVFGPEPRDAAWEEIKAHNTEGWLEELPELEREISQISKTPVGTTCPLSILLAPRLFQDYNACKDESLGWITRIRVYFRPDKLERIRNQIKLLEPQLLLFVNSLQQIRIKEDANEPRTLTRGETWRKLDDVNGATIESCELSCDGATDVWNRYIFRDDEQEIAFAWLDGNRPIPDRMRVAYSYFPTAFQLPMLPCILHATFRLSSSRNGIDNTKTNWQLMEHAGRHLAVAASWIAAHTDLNRDHLDARTVWFPYSMLNIGDPGSSELLKSLKRGVISGAGEANVCPVVSRTYMKAKEVVSYSEDFASYLTGGAGSSRFANHLWPGYSQHGFNAAWSDKFIDEAQGLAGEQLEAIAQLGNASPGAYNDYVNMVEAFLSVRNVLQNPSSLSCLPDSRLRLIPSNIKTARINSGLTLDEASDNLGIRYVDENFIQSYKNRLGLPPDEWDGGRGLVRHLKTLTRCTSSDISPMKEMIVAVSRKGYPDEGPEKNPNECFKNVVRSLYRVYCDNPDTEGMSCRLHVLNELGNHIEVSSACLWDAKARIGLSSLVPDIEVPARWKLKWSLDEWCGILCPETELNEQIRQKVARFLTEFIGVSAAIPCCYDHCSRALQYVESQLLTAEVPSGDKLKPVYFCEGKWSWSEKADQDRADVKTSRAHYESNFMRRIDPDFIAEMIRRGMRPIDFLRLVAEDAKVYQSLQGKQHLWYSLIKEKPCAFQESYLAHQLKAHAVVRKLQVRESGPRHGRGEASDAEVRFSNVLKILGLTKDMENMSAPELYDRIASWDKPAGAQSHYSSIRMALRELIRRQKVSEEACAELAKEKLKRLFARESRNGVVELRDREKIYYWDNAIVSQSLLDQLPKLEIGSRVGAKSVATLFGVKALNADAVEVTPEARTRVVSKEHFANALRNFLSVRRKYFLAARVRYADVDDLRSDLRTEAKKLDWRMLEVVAPMEGVFRLKDSPKETYGLSNGDTLVTKEDSWLCSDHETLEEALKDHVFCDSIVEMLCIRFGLTGTQIESAFREILQFTDEQNEYYSRRGISDEAWDRVQRSLGASPEELVFWKTVAEKCGKIIDDSSFQRLSFELGGWKTILREWRSLDELPASIQEMPDFADMTAVQLARLGHWSEVSPVHVQGLAKEKIKEELLKIVDNVRFGVEKNFEAAYFNKLLENQELQNGYVEVVHLFKLPQTWYPVAESFFARETFPEDLNEATKNACLEFVEKKFGVKLSDVKQNARPKPLPEYDEIIKGFDIARLNYVAQSWLLFPGNAEKIRAAVDERKRQDENDAEACSESLSVAEDNSPILVKSVAAADLQVLHDYAVADKKTNATLHRHGQNFESDLKKYARGEAAESVVRRMLMKWKADGTCLDFGARSKISNAAMGTTVFADDGAHFDFWYKLNDGQVRFLEAKAYSGTRFLMSVAEYETARSALYADRYDLCLVKEGVPYFIKGPLFGPKSKYAKRILPMPETYSVRISINLSEQT